MIEIVSFTKTNGPLSKRIWLAPDGTVKSNGDACVMAHGRAERVRLSGAADLAALIEGVQSNQALGLGALRDGLPDRVDVVTKAKLNGAVNVIARTGDSIKYRSGELDPAELTRLRNDVAKRSGLGLRRWRYAQGRGRGEAAINLILDRIDERISKLEAKP